MKQFSNQEYNEALLLTSKDVRQVLSSTKIYDCTENILKDKYPNFDCSLLVLPIGDYLLNLLSTKEVLEEIKNFDISDQDNILKLIEDCLHKVDVQTSTVNDLETEIAEIETAAQSLSGVRTMQNDIERIQQETPIHQSSQDALLQRGDTPVQQTPQWDTQ